MLTITSAIPEIAEMEKDSLVDVIGVVLQVGELTLVKARSGKEIGKRNISIVDRSLISIDLTIWGATAEKFADNFNGIVAIKGAKVSNFNSRTLTMQASSQLICNPDITEAYLLQGWYVRN